jgi:hypothetical protein
MKASGGRGPRPPSSRTTRAGDADLDLSRSRAADAMEDLEATRQVAPEGDEVQLREEKND